ncbi:DcaP family trimeric outer membrane transporter [Marinobacter salsuginis]|uniref:DcaP family trimeric outer membrane transporter n=2 Tax=Marinobacteraceae TaxID=2887365 RepID=UPI003009C14F
MKKRFCTFLSLSAFSLTASAIEINAGQSTATIYGFAKLNMIYDVDARLGTFVTHKGIALDDENVAEGHTQFDASHSRLGVKILTDTPRGAVTTVIEGDFNTPAGTGPFRLRHAYAQWNGIIAGQYWTNFWGGLSTLPTLDHLGQVGQGAVLRQPQLRYTSDGFSIALEDGGSWRGSVSSSSDPSISPANKNELPDLTAKYQGKIGPAKAGISGVIRQIQYYDQASNSEESGFGYGINVETQIPLSDLITLRGAITYGQGMGGYQYQNPSDPAYVDTDGDLEVIDSFGTTLGLSLRAGPGSFNMGYGMSKADIDDAVEAGALSNAENESYDSIYLNYIWSPMSGVTYGLEAGRHTREAQNGDDGEAVRVQAQVVYAF